MKHAFWGEGTFSIVGPNLKPPKLRGAYSRWRGRRSGFGWPCHRYRMDGDERYLLLSFDFETKILAIATVCRGAPGR